MCDHRFVADCAAGSLVILVPIDLLSHHDENPRHDARLLDDVASWWSTAKLTKVMGVKDAVLGSN